MLFILIKKKAKKAFLMKECLLYILVFKKRVFKELQKIL
ncbi:hypothetical protein FH5_02354 [Priestia endophytica]|nr:hypothetical protein FH5_02354 [Priestia endophytica]